MIALRNIGEWSPEEILDTYENCGGSFARSAYAARCSRPTFKKYYERALTCGSKPAREVTKSMSSEKFLDPRQSRVALLDIETTGLAADFSVTLCAVIKEFGGNYVKTFSVELDAMDILESERIMIDAIGKELKKFDGIITYFGSRFDIPFLRTRAFFHGIAPIPKCKHLDMYFTIRSNTNPSTRRMDRINQILQNSYPDDSPTKTNLGISQWIKVLHSRDETSLEYIVDHCQKDVLILENIVNKFGDFVPDRITRK